MEDVAPESLFPSEDPEPKCSVSAIKGILCCPVCTLLLDRPIELGCGTILCLKCCKSWVQFQCKQSLSCPCCYDHRLDSSHIRPPPSLVVSLLNGLLVHCTRMCGKIVRVDHYQKHLQGLCMSHYHQRIDSPSKLTISEVLSRPTTSPVTPAEVRVAGHLVRKIMDSGGSSSEGVVKVQTRGQVSKQNIKYTTITLPSKQPITLVQVASCRVSSSEASKWTLKRRTESIKRVRSLTSGGDTTVQMAAEVKSLSKEEREKIILEAQLPIIIPTDHALALKADLSIPWCKLRVLRR